MAGPIPVTDCCKKAQTMSFSIQNAGSVDKTFRLFGGGTGLNSVDNNVFTTTPGFISTSAPADQLGPGNIIYNPDLNLIYAINNSPLYPAVTPTISVIDSNNQVINTVQIIAGVLLVSGVYVSSNNTLYVGDLGGSVVFAINTLTYVVTEIVVGNNPFWVTYAPDLLKVYASNSSDGTVSIIDINTNLVIATPFVGNSPQVMTYASSSQSVYVLNFNDGTVSVIAGSNLVVATINIGLVTGSTYSDIIYGNGTVFACGSGDNKVYVVNPLTNSLVTSINVGNSPSFLAYNATNNILYCANIGSYTISVINAISYTVSSTIIPPIPSGGQSMYMVYNTTDGYLYMSCSLNNTVQVFNSSNNLVVSYTGSDGISNPFNLTFNGRNDVYVANNGSQNVFFVTTTQSVTITVNGGQNTLEEINNNTLTNPISICDMKFTGTDKTIFNNLLYKNYLSSSGVTEGSDLSLLTMYTAMIKTGVNTLTVDSSAFKTPVLDGKNYLQWVVPGNKQIDIAIDYCQYDLTKQLAIENGTLNIGEHLGLLQIQSKRRISRKKYSHGAFKYIYNR